MRGMGRGKSDQTAPADVPTAADSKRATCACSSVKLRGAPGEGGQSQEGSGWAASPDRPGGLPADCPVPLPGQLLQSAAASMLVAPALHHCTYGKQEINAAAG